MNAKRPRGRPRLEREIRIELIRREEIDVRKLARALLALAQSEADRELLQRQREEESDEPS